MEHVVMENRPRRAVLDPSAETDRRPRCAPSVGVLLTGPSANRDARHNHYDRRLTPVCLSCAPTFLSRRTWHNP